MIEATPGRPAITKGDHIQADSITERGRRGGEETKVERVKKRWGSETGGKLRKSEWEKLKRWRVGKIYLERKKRGEEERLGAEWNG